MNNPRGDATDYYKGDSVSIQPNLELKLTWPTRIFIKFCTLAVPDIGSKKPKKKNFGQVVSEIWVEEVWPEPLDLVPLTACISASMLARKMIFVSIFRAFKGLHGHAI